MFPKFQDIATRWKVIGGTCSPVVLVLAIGAASLYGMHSMTESSRWVEHTYNVIGKAEGIVASAVDMETGMRGFLLAGKEEFLDPYNAGEGAVYAGLADLRETVNDNPAQVDRLSEAEQVLREWQSEVTGPMIALRREVGDARTMDDIADLVGEARGKVFFDKFRQIMADFEAEEAGLMEIRKATSQDTVDFTRILLWGGMAAALAIAVGFGWMIGNAVGGPIHRMARAMRQLAQGDAGVEIPGVGRRDEIGQMAQAVQVFKDNAAAKVEIEQNLETHVNSAV
jgi:methyl-accepting chemotaxis protein